MNANIVTAVKPLCSILYITIGVVALLTILISQTEACNNQDLAVFRFLEHGRKNQKRENVNIYTFQQDTHCRSTDCLLILRCQLYMFRAVMVHPQELLFRCS